MQLINKASIEIKKSKFYAYLYQINSKEDVKEILSNLKEEHKKANHIPYAYQLENTAGKSDDKEPKGTSANPIYNNLQRSHLKNHAIFVVRYFGGTKLGAPGLIRAYNEASKEVLKENKA